MATWTEEQRQAIYNRGCNLLVSAAAGSGKTAVLVERIIQYVCDENNPVDIDRLLVVTFTNAAAAEMRERVGLAINRALQQNPKSEHLYRQSTLLNKASIMTLHSFCLELVRENFYHLGIDPNFRIADDTEGELLRLDVLEELLESYYAQGEGGSDFTRLVDAYGGRHDDQLIKNLVLKLYNFSRSTPWPDHWLQQMQHNFTAFDWFSVLQQSVAIELTGIKALLQQAAHLANQHNGPAVYLPTLEQEQQQLDTLIAAAEQHWEQLYQAFLAVHFAKLPPCRRTDADAELIDKVKDLRDKAKKKLIKLRDSYFNRSAAELREDLLALQPHVAVLVQLVTDFARSYQQQKNRRNLVDFNDLEHYCLRLLMDESSRPGHIVPSELSNKLKERFAEVLVDEYQDTNEVQETILQLVAKDNNLFMVGDVKQSIYRFRLANPELFLKKYQTYRPAAHPAGQRIDLAKNFRCRQGVVEAVNFIFQQIMTPQLGEMPYDERAMLVYGAHYPVTDQQSCLEGPVELYLLDKEGEQQQGEKEDTAAVDLTEELSDFAREAKVIADRIKQLMAEGYTVFDKHIGGYRPLTYRDVVILLRSLRGTAEELAEQFRLQGIPAYADLGSGYFAATEVQTMLALLHVIDNPQQDIPLAAVLRSPIVGLTAEELSAIRLAAPGADFYQGLLNTARTDTPLGQKLKQFLQQLDDWRTLARQGSLADLIWTLYRQTGYFHYVGAMPEGTQRQANLRALHDRARRYEETSFRGLFRFLRFLERLQQNKGDMEAAKALGENENVVRIMSIHKSKGLEFPVVFVAGLGKRFNQQDLHQDVILHKDLGLGLVYVDAEKRIKYPTVAKLAIEHRVRMEALAEEMRILYVALTRAREKLVLIGTVNKLHKKLADWCRFLDYPGIAFPDSELSQSKSYLDWLVPAVLRHPDGEPLRQAAQYSGMGKLLHHPSRWQVTLPEHQPSQAPTPQQTTMLQLVQQYQPVPADNRWQGELARRLDWQYPHRWLANKRAKTSVSEIKHKFQQWLQQEEQARVRGGFTKSPQFLQEKRQLSGAERGSALHLVMQHVDLTQPVTEERVESLLEQLELRQILTPAERAAVDSRLVVQFFQTSLGKQLLEVAQQDGRVLRELPFSLALPAHQIYDDLPQTDEKVLVQGIIDCLWYHDGWNILDYKSDRVPPGGREEIIARYQGQLALYSYAVAVIYRQRVKGAYLYLFDTGEVVPVGGELWPPEGSV